VKVASCGIAVGIALPIHAGVVGAIRMTVTINDPIAAAAHLAPRLPDRAKNEYMKEYLVLEWGERV